ncbi:MAG: hypothetical protein ABR976_08380 [Terracidiphilus sp.]|jgi:hypothetical protein
MRNLTKYCLCVFLLLTFPTRQTQLMAETGDQAKTALGKALLGKDVKALLDMPAYKDGLDLYVYPKSEKSLDDRGLDLKELAKYLKDKGVGVERDEWVTITDVKVDSDRVEIHLGGGGEGRGASKNAEKKGAGFKRAGGSRINFRYGRDLTDLDIQIDTFMPLLARVLDTGKIRDKMDVAGLPPEFQEAIRAKDIIEGMTYQMVLWSAGEPDQKKVEDTTDDSLHETWYYLRDGRRWVVKFLNGKVAKVQVY